MLQPYSGGLPAGMLQPYSGGLPAGMLQPYVGEHRFFNDGD